MIPENRPMTDIIILLNGGFIPIRVLDSDVKITLDLIKGGIKSAFTDQGHYIQPDKDCLILSKNITGYYTRKVTETSQEKIVRLVERAVDGDSSGDEWKRG